MFFFFSLSGKKTISCLRKYIKEISLSIWLPHRNKSSPGYSACSLHIAGPEENIHRFYGRFFPKQRLNRGYSNSKGLGHTILCNFSTDQMVIELTKI